MACSAGSACHTVPSPDPNSSEPSTTLHYTISEVLQAMEVPEEFALGTVRLSCGRYSTMEEMDIVTQELFDVVIAMWRQRGILPPNTQYVGSVIN